MKQLPDILTDAQALATIPEDQFEAANATLVADIQALIAAGNPQAPTATSVTITFSDGSTQTVSDTPPQP